MRTYRDFSPTFPNRDDWSLAHVVRQRADTHGDRVFLEYPLTGEEVTFRQLLEVCSAIGSALLSRGSTPGDRMLLMLENTVEFVLAWVAAGLADLVEVPINTAYEGSFLAHQVAAVQPTACVIHAGYATRFVAIGDACASVKCFYVVGDAEDVDAAITLLTDAGWEAQPFGMLRNGGDATLPDVASRGPGAIFFTSGTTGPAKGVIMPHSQIHFFADQLCSLTRLTDDDIYLATGPMFHGNAQFLAAYPALIRGARFVLRERFSATNWSRWVSESGATVTNLIGVMMDFVWKQPADPDDERNDLRCIFAVPTPPSIADGFRARFGFDVFVEAYGMTEVSMPMLTPYGEPRPPGACGLLVDEWFDVRIVDQETDEEVPEGELGELLVRAKAPWTMNVGYYGMPERTVEAYRNLWFHTGDGVRRDRDGWYYFVDRLSDTIRRRGENIGPYEIEQAVLEIPGVRACAVVAVPADEGTEDELALFVIPEDDRVSSDDIRDACRERLPGFALPRDVHLVTELPTTPSGKIRRGELRATARQLSATSEAP